jgi:hypothetical protein
MLGSNLFFCGGSESCHCELSIVTLPCPVWKEAGYLLLSSTVNQCVISVTCNGYSVPTFISGYFSMNSEELGFCSAFALDSLFCSMDNSQQQQQAFHVS